MAILIYSPRNGGIDRASHSFKVAQLEGGGVGSKSHPAMMILWVGNTFFG